eukprot:3442508-Rhodomonas_salina.3
MEGLLPVAYATTVLHVSHRTPPLLPAVVVSWEHHTLSQYRTPPGHHTLSQYPTYHAHRPVVPPATSVLTTAY